MFVYLWGNVRAVHGGHLVDIWIIPYHFLLHYWVKVLHSKPELQGTTSLTSQLALHSTCLCFLGKSNQLSIMPIWNFLYFLGSKRRSGAIYKVNLSLFFSLATLWVLIFSTEHHNIQY